VTISFFPPSSFQIGERRAMLIGRAAEMRELEDALDDVRTKKHPRTVTVLGAPGVGKTRLVREFLVRAHTQDGQAPRVFRGSAREKGPSYGVFGRVLRARFGLSEGMEEEVAKTSVRTHLAKVLEDRKVGDVAYFLGQLMDLEFIDSPLIKAVEDEPEQLRQLRRAVIRRFFEADAAAQEPPLVLVFDDLHNAHDDSLDLLEHLVHTVSGSILIVRVARSELLAKRDGWKRNDVRHTTVELSPLSETDAAAMIQDLLAPCGEAEAVEDLIDAACTLAGGNPALLEQMVRIYHDMGVLEVADPLAENEQWVIHPEKLKGVRLPITVEDAITARIAALAPSEREMLERAAAVGGVFWLNALLVMHRTAAGAPNVDPAMWSGGETPDVARIREILKDLRERDYVLRLPDSTFHGDEEYVFKHNKERETLKRLTPPGAARKYHAAIAEWLSSKDTALHEEYVAMLARHREKAGLKTLAAQSYLRAADIARGRYAHAIAAEYYGRALDLHGQGAELTADEHLQCLHHQGDVLQVLGKVDDALAAFRAMLKEAFRLDRRGNAGAAHSRIGRYYRDTGRLSEADQHLRAALALFTEAGDDRGIASTKDDIGKLHWLRGDYVKALETTQAALQMRRRIGDRRSIALSLNNLGLVYQDSGQFRQALDAFEQALLIRREIGDLVGVAITLNNLGTVAQDQRDDQRALSLFQEALEVAKETGDRNRIALVSTNLGETLTRLGDSARAIEYLKQAEELCDELGDKLGLAEAVRGLGKAYLARREYTRARECIGRAVQIFEQVQSRVQLAIALRSLGEVTAAGSAGGEDLQRARAFFQESIRIFQDTGNEVELGRSLRAFAEALKGAPDVAADPAFKKEVDDARTKADDIFARLKLDALGL
jgi:tetratricopeptide (TPR) repeat protein/type II secretory pathway predicted ATPase ExeA